jgi:hypothetical protein
MGADFVALDFLAATRELLADHINSEDASAVGSYIGQFLWRARRAARDCTFSLAQGAILDGPEGPFGRKIKLNLGFQPLSDFRVQSPLQIAAALCGSHLFLLASAYEGNAGCCTRSMGNRIAGREYKGDGPMRLMLHCSSRS